MINFAGAMRSPVAQMAGAKGVRFGAEGAPKLTKDVTDASFQAEVVDASLKQPVLVDFWAPWCPPCRNFAPVYDQLAQTYQGRAKFTKVMVSDAQRNATNLGRFQQYGGKSIPALMLFVNGQAQKVFGQPPQILGSPSAMKKSEIAALIDAALVPTP